MTVVDSGVSPAPYCFCSWKRWTSWAFQVLTAVILVQTLFFKFTGSSESVYIFSTLGVEPWGRYLAGVSELLAAALILIPRTAVLGALLSLGVITGALGAHFTKLGIVVQHDGGLLFSLALAVFASSAVVLLLRRHQIPILGRRLTAACPTSPP